MEQKPLFNITFVLDERLSREKAQLLIRIINALRHLAQITILPGSTRESTLLEKISESAPHLILAPWYRYLAWSKVEAFFGLTRNSGPTFAGYFADQLLPYELGTQADHLRAILFDFTHLRIHEIQTLVRSLLHENMRAGLRGLVGNSTPIYGEDWISPHGQGMRAEAVFNLPSMQSGQWSDRAAAVRICVSSLWSLVFSQGPGKKELLELVQAAASQTKSRATFEVSADQKCLALRLFFYRPGWTPKDILEAFWPDALKPTAPAQLLLKYSDFLRVHPISNTPWVEVIVGFLQSAPAEISPSELHSLWIEPLSKELVPATKGNRPLLPELSAVAASDGRPTILTQKLKVRERQIQEMSERINELRKELYDKCEVIRELRSGGLGTPPKAAIPDGQTLLDAFSERYSALRQQIQQLELEIVGAESEGESPLRLRALKKRIALVAETEQAWIHKLVALLQTYRDRTG